MVEDVLQGDDGEFPVSRLGYLPFGSNISFILYLVGVFIFTNTKNVLKRDITLG